MPVCQVVHCLLILIHHLLICFSNSLHLLDLANRDSESDFESVRTWLDAAFSTSGRWMKDDATEGGESAGDIMIDGAGTEEACSMDTSQDFGRRGQTQQGELSHILPWSLLAPLLDSTVPPVFLNFPLFPSLFIAHPTPDIPPSVSALPYLLAAPIPLSSTLHRGDDKLPWHVLHRWTSRASGHTHAHPWTEHMLNGLIQLAHLGRGDTDGTHGEV